MFADISIAHKKKMKKMQKKEIMKTKSPVIMHKIVLILLLLTCTIHAQVVSVRVYGIKRVNIIAMNGYD